MYGSNEGLSTTSSIMTTTMVVKEDESSGSSSSSSDSYQAFYCAEKSSPLTDRVLATCILTSFFFIGTGSNLLFICIYLYKQRRRTYFVRARSLGPACIRFKSQVNNKAIFTLSISNLLLSSVFIPYTIIYRVWNLKANVLVLKCIEHLKDTFIYVNVLIILLLSIERYVAVCKPHYYKKLEINVDRIIWLVFLFGVSLSATNYFVTVKSKQDCESYAMATTSTTTTMGNINYYIVEDGGEKTGDIDSPYRLDNDKGIQSITKRVQVSTANDDYNPFLFTASRTNDGEQQQGRRPFNINFLISAILVSVSGVTSTFFYIQIARHHLRAMRLNNKRFKVREQLARDDDECEDNPTTAAFRGEEVSSSQNNKELESSTAAASSSALRPCRRSTKSFSFSSTTTTGLTTTTIEMSNIGGMTATTTTMNNNQIGGGQHVKYSISSCSAEPVKNWRKSSEMNKLNRASFLLSNNNNNNNNNNIEESSSNTEMKNKLDASVQTDLMVNIRKLVRKRNSNIFASNLITKISIWLSVIIWMSILPFLLSILRIIPYYKFIYFLYFTESVFSPLVYVCLNKRYRNYLKKFLRLNFK